MILLNASTNTRCYTINTKLPTHNPKSVAEHILSIKRPKSFEKMMHKYIHTCAESSGVFKRNAINSCLTFIRGQAKPPKAKSEKARLVVLAHHEPNASVFVCHTPCSSQFTLARTQRQPYQCFAYEFVLVKEWYI